jgi:hypothetical protein
MKQGLVVEAGDPDLSSAAALAIGEVLAAHLHGSGRRLPVMRCDAMAALRFAVGAEHPEHSPRAAALLEELSALPDHDKFDDEDE